MIAPPQDTSRESFEGLVASGYRVIPVTRSLFADAETPVSIYRKLAAGRPGSFLLESAEQGGIWSRFSFVGVSSFGVLTDIDDESHWISYGLSEETAFGGSMAPTGLAALRQLYERWETPHLAHMPPLTGGLVGFIGWEAIRQIENLPTAPPADYVIPTQALSFARDLIVLDHKFGTVTLISNVLGLEPTTSPRVLFDEAIARLDALQAQLAQPAEVGLARIDLEAPPSAAMRTAHADFLASVVTAQRHVVDGDVFQVVLSQRFDIHNNADPIDVYRVLRSLNPSPYMYLLALETVDNVPYAIVGSSPEALVKISDRRVFTRPIAGSRPRGDTPERDNELEHELLADEKERSEHLMLVDLSRNDLLKVCQPGSVEVTEFMRVERFSHIMHIVSSVEGDLTPGLNSVDAFRATFPAGTLSGAPKPRALRIIDDLEPSQRGPYGGVVGYFGFAGDADLAIAIRTATLINNMAYVQAGAGLVMDSDPETEYVETQNKAAAPLRAVAIANSLVKL
ncbi:anthranilate synthase component I [Alpinimonas psychrophila]|uniref:Anthranilate synthase component 1 n=1 Tax=Alpinimonas psychrophila TaxID=748908 RepID=A0A7W3JSW9_9MICO|nr:anthranilate synthase component I [Alpinimonas psychrophila]MBA8828502.1 anthranilate synthase component 1 [Alpinimonas psychrophila]